MASAQLATMDLTKLLGYVKNEALFTHRAVARGDGKFMYMVPSSGGRITI
jgi:hypothetical protein